MKVGIVGMTHMGLITTNALASHRSLYPSPKDLELICYDSDHHTIDALNNNKLPIYEPGLIAPHLMGAHFTRTLSDVYHCAYIFVTVDIEVHTEAKLRPLRDLVRTIAANSPGSVIILMSQVPVGFCRSLKIVPNLFYMMDTLIYGSSVSRSLHREQVVIGMDDLEPTLPHEHLMDMGEFISRYLSVDANAVFHWVTYETAEHAKIAINCFLYASVQMATYLAGVGATHGVDWNAVMPILLGDKRVGTYIKPGLGVNGGHMKRDMIAATNMGGSERETSLMIGCLTQNYYARQWVNELLPRLQYETVAVWGLAYKAGTDSTISSPGLALALRLRARVHDPVVLAPGMKQFANPIDAATGADTLCIMTPWPDYSEVFLPALYDVMVGDKVIIDPFGVFDGKKHGKHYYRLGSPHGIARAIHPFSSEDS